MLRDDGCVPKPIGADIPRRATTPKEVFGFAITRLRTDKKQSQATVAAAVGCREQFLRSVERGRRNFSFDLEYALIQYFEMLPASRFWVFAEKLAERGDPERT